MNKDFTDFIEEWDEYLLERTGHTDREHKFARTVKLSEEVGELASEVLAAEGDQRKEKLLDKTREDLESEFADVLITLHLLAKSYDVDMEKVAMRKIERIRAKGKEVA
jgi:NTP pyrophosphatase (non-canonical NTP hydrolase)